jgi:hypothetical protein
VNNFMSPHMMVTIVFAEKGPDSTTDLSPIQQPYRSVHDWGVYRRNLRKMQGRGRHHLVRTLGELLFRNGTGGYLIVANDFSVLHSLPEPPHGKGRGLSQYSAILQNEASVLASGTVLRCEA